MRETRQRARGLRDKTWYIKWDKEKVRDKGTEREREKVKEREREKVRERERERK